MKKWRLLKQPNVIVRRKARLRKKPGNAVANPWSVSRGGQYKVQYAGRGQEAEGKPAAATAVDARSSEEGKRGE